MVLVSGKVHTRNKLLKFIQVDKWRVSKKSGAYPGIGSLEISGGLTPNPQPPLPGYAPAKSNAQNTETDIVKQNQKQNQKNMDYNTEWISLNLQRPKGGQGNRLKIS